MKPTKLVGYWYKADAAEGCFRASASSRLATICRIDRGQLDAGLRTAFKGFKGLPWPEVASGTFPRARIEQGRALCPPRRRMFQQVLQPGTLLAMKTGAPGDVAVPHEAALVGETTAHVQGGEVRLHAFCCKVRFHICMKTARECEHPVQPGDPNEQVPPSVRQ